MSEPGRLAPAPERRAALEQRFAPWTEMTVAGVLERAAEEFGQRPLVIGEHTSFSYAEVSAWARRIGAGLVALGVTPGNHVAVVIANHPEFAAVKFAIAWAGATCVPINFLFRTPELAYVLAQSDATVLITMDRHRDLDYRASLDELSPGWETAGGGERLPGLRHVVSFSPEGEPARAGAMSLADLERLGDDGGGAALAELDRRSAAADPRSYSDILYTSGTTGAPKGVLLRHDQIVRESYAAAYQRALEDGRRIIFPMPMYHVFGYMEGLMAVLFVGGAIVPQVTFDAARMLEQMAAHQVNEVMAVPAVTLPLIAEIRRRGADLGSVHTVFSSGGVAPPSIWDDIREVFGDVELTTGYGQTETTATTTCTNPEDDDWFVRHTNGRPRDGGIAGDPQLGGRVATYKTIDLLTGEDLEPGRSGQLVARGMVITDGYYEKPEETAEAFTPDGWLLTGDIGSIDGDGLRLTGRLKESFRVGGEMVMPQEIENVLAEHAAVAQAHVVGIPHARMGEVACAWVIPADGEPPPDPELLVTWCAERLARFKVPRPLFAVAPPPAEPRD